MRVSLEYHHSMFPMILNYRILGSIHSALHTTVRVPLSSLISYHRTSPHVSPLPPSSHLVGPGRSCIGEGQEPLV